MTNEIKKIISSLLLASISSGIAYGYELHSTTTEFKNDLGAYISTGNVPVKTKDAGGVKYWTGLNFAEFEAHADLFKMSNLLTDLKITSYFSSPVNLLSIGATYKLNNLGEISIGYNKAYDTNSSSNYLEIPENSNYVIYRTEQLMNSFSAEILWSDGDNLYSSDTSLSLQYSLNEKSSVRLTYETVSNWSGSDLERYELSSTVKVSDNMTFTVGYSQFDTTDDTTATDHVGSFRIDTKM
ncbi:MAG: hypothetical protein VX335_02300 [Pseudomonadota bacterium]|nr:hypothetical protein [Pseudomonadota bacterium]